MHWETLLELAGALLLMFYVLAPVVIRLTLRQPASPEQLIPFDADDPTLPDKVAEHVKNVVHDLEPLGFEAFRGLFLPNSSLNVQTFVFMLVHRRSKDAACATAMYAPSVQGTDLRTAHLEISSRFRDGSLVSTSNATILSAFPVRPQQTKTQVPMVQKSDRLYRLHQAVLQGHAGTAEKTLRLTEEFQGDVVAYIRSSMSEELEDAASAGYMYRSPNEAVFRPTWKGAYLMTWSQLWPLRAIKSALVKRKALRLLEELE